MAQANNNHNNGDDDEQYARDLQYALEVEYAEQIAQEYETAQQQGTLGSSNASGSRPHAWDQPPMLFVRAQIENQPVAMLVDSGASHSVISYTLASQLGWTHRINPYVTGQATGVGDAARIVGVLEHLGCIMGHVEFRLFFLVLQSSSSSSPGSNDSNKRNEPPWLILGLDQMRRFRCVLDLEDNCLRFGGKDGVAVPLLDDEQTREAMAAHRTSSPPSAVMVLPPAPRSAPSPLASTETRSATRRSTTPPPSQKRTSGGWRNPFGKK